MKANVHKVQEIAQRNRRRLATVGVALVACWFGYIAVYGQNGMLGYLHKRAEYRQLQQKVMMMQQENERLTRENHALKNDPAAIEREAREQLRYTKPGEVVYVQPEQLPQTPATATAQNTH